MNKEQQEVIETWVLMLIQFCEHADYKKDRISSFLHSRGAEQDHINDAVDSLRLKGLLK